MPVVLALLMLATTPSQAQCPLGGGLHASSYLDVNGVNARLNPSEVHFFRGYEVPAGSSIQTMYLANLMIAGKVNGETRAIQAHGGGEMWPGPLDESGNPPDDCTIDDRVFNVSLHDIAAYETSGNATPDLLEWPWRIGAPVKDGDGIPDNYDLAAGDRPGIEGHQMLWWVMNDKGGWDPTPRNSQIGLEIQVSAFAATSDDPVVEYATLYRYKLTHRGDAPLTNAYFGQWVDADLGNLGDDFVGSDTALGLAYTYNGDDFDEDTSAQYPGYGDRPPALGVIIVQGLPGADDGVDNDKDGSVDEPGEQLPMSKFVTWGSDNTTTGDPNGDEDVYRYLRGRWRDDIPITYGGNGRSFTSIPIDFMYPGDPPGFWSMENQDGTGRQELLGDHTFMWSTGPFSLDVGESTELVVAYLWARGEDRYDSIRRLKEAVPEIRGYWSDGFHFALPPLPAPPSTAPNLLSPGDGAFDQPLDTQIRWESIDGQVHYEVQISQNMNFSPLIDSLSVTRTTFDLRLMETGLYFWRVRAANKGGVGPWSDVHSFQTGVFTNVGPGPLDIDGSEAWAFIQIAGVGPGDACGPNAESTYGCLEVGGNRVYGSFNGAGDWVMYHEGQEEGPETTIGAFAPHDFEIRFTEEGSFGYDATNRRASRVPFEVWDIGWTWPANINDPSDDVRLIPSLDTGSRTDCIFGFREDANDPFGLGWPVTNPLGAAYPAHGSTYGDWESIVQPLVETHVDGCLGPPGTEEVLLLVDAMRQPLQNIVFIMDPASPNYRDEGIPLGNVIRFLTTKPTPPFLASPRDGEDLPTAARLDRLSLWWQLPTGVTNGRLQIDTSGAFSNLLVDTLVSGSTFELEDVAPGEYHWRVGYATDHEFWSVPWYFTVTSIVGNGTEGPELPSVLTLRPAYPNPAANIAHFDVGLPETGRVRLTAYDLLGRRIANIADDPMAAGCRTVGWNTAAVSNGVYVVRLQAGGAAVSTKVVVVK